MSYNTPNRKKGFLSSRAVPSTTPKYSPPTYLTNQSTTPHDDPPRKIFGSSFNAANNTFGHRATPGRRQFMVLESSPPRDDDDEGEDEDAEGEMDEDYTRPIESPQKSVRMSLLGGSPRGLKRSRNGRVREQADSGISEIALVYANSSPPSQLIEPDNMVIQTENILPNLESNVREQPASYRDETLTGGVSKLTKLWSQYSKKATKPGAVGPQSDDAVTKANYLSTLLLQLYHPHSTKPTFAPSVSRAQRALINPRQSQTASIPLPRALLDWLNTYHNAFPDDFDAGLTYRPSPSANEVFWDIVYSNMLRGRVDRVMRLLKDGGWQHAYTAQDDGSGDGYRGRQLENTEEVVARLIRVLEMCPAATNNDWDVKGADWQIFRQRIRRAISELESFARDNEIKDDQPPNQSSDNIFARTQDNYSMSTASTRARSSIPWTIYENLKTVYGILLGNNMILDFSQDWLEAALLLTVWWDGEEAALLADTSLRQSTSGSLRKSMRAGGGTTREVDVSPLTAYRRRLGEVIRTIMTDMVGEAMFEVDSMDVVQVGLACVMEGSTESVIGILRTWSPTITAAVVEVAAMGAWLPSQARPNGRRGLLEQGFSSEDLMVLSHGPGQQHQESEAGEVDRDTILTEYAELLAAKAVFESKDDVTEREGWEMAVEVLGRLDDAHAAQTRITALLDGMQFADEAKVDKVLELCGQMGFSELAQGIAERYADTLASSTGQSSSYGPALIYYARAHATNKLKRTLAFLTSLCLLHSAAMPADTLDPRLDSLLSKQRTALVGLSHADPDAAALLSSSLSGYATVRRAYELRDQDGASSSGAKMMKPLERKREAAKALVAVIESAADCIRGGLFDPEIESVVPVDALLALLGETLPLLGQQKRIFSQGQVFTLMRIVEDFATAPGRIREGAEGLVQASLKSYRGDSSASNSALLKKSRSNLSAASGSGSGLGCSSWDMLASSAAVVQRGETEKGKMVSRGWDWRKGLDAVVADRDVRVEEVLLLLRTALAMEVGRGWGGAVHW